MTYPLGLASIEIMSTTAGLLQESQFPVEIKTTREMFKTHEIKD